MKKLISLALAAVLLVSIFGIALADETEATSYKITDYSYDGEFVSGKVVVSGAPLEEGKRVNVRATFFLEGNNYMSTTGQIDEDGTFSITASGSIEHITLVVFTFVRLSDKTSHTKYSESAVGFDVKL
ncbi:MAG: hypothetical protein IKN04_19720 [Clostridia bacterium]|nr:hypothetical protein [Clostridia bacterium]